MSLTSSLKHRESIVSDFFRKNLRNVRPLRQQWKADLAGAETITVRVKKAAAYPFRVVGAAADYRLRYYFAATPTSDLKAGVGARLLVGDMAPWSHPWAGLACLVPGAADIGKVALKVLEQVDNAVREFRPTGKRLRRSEEDRLCRYCIVLALLEQIYRAGPLINSPLLQLGHGATPDDLLHLVQRSWILDLRRLSWAFYDRYNGLFARPFVLNPTFAGSADVGGADADLIVDGCIIEVKTTIWPALRSEWIHQLVGYTLLDYDDQYHIDSVAIYLTRQARLVHWPIEELIRVLGGNPTITLSGLRQEFRRLVASANPGGTHNADAVASSTQKPAPSGPVRSKPPRTAAEAFARYPDRCPGTYEPGIPNGSGLVKCARCSYSVSPRRGNYPWPHLRADSES